MLNKTNERKARYFRGVIKNNHGSQMVEAAICLPIVVLGIMLLIRLFTFYLEILNTTISEQEIALQECVKYSGKIMKNYESNKDVEMLPGGLLNVLVNKEINTKAYMVNEDCLVRAKYIIGED